MKNNKNDISGVINIYKEKGFTSHDVVAIIRNKLGKIKTGHTGTLDPDAVGVLPICVGKATKLSEYIMAENKVYLVGLKLGLTTDTFDSSGSVILKRPINASYKEIEKTILSFVGESEQLPPMYSAIKINGKKLYELARKGQEIERKTRTINIENIEILNISTDEVKMRVFCSKGTYIRSLCYDIGEKLLCGGIMNSLVREKTGKFHIDDAIKIEDFKKLIDSNDLDNVLIKTEDILDEYKKISIIESGNKYLYNGNKLSLNLIKEENLFELNEIFRVYDYQNNLIGLYQVETSVNGKIGNNYKILKPKIMLYDSK